METFCLGTTINYQIKQQKQVSYVRGNEVDNAINETRRKELSKNYGVTGVFIFYIWYHLCMFDHIHDDLVIDIMHLVLNLV